VGLFQPAARPGAARRQKRAVRSFCHRAHRGHRGNCRWTCLFSVISVTSVARSFYQGFAMDKKTIEKVDLKGKRVFIRADFNVPIDENGNITDDTRIRSTLPTINYALDAGAKVILASHLGRPKGRPAPKYSLAPVATRLSRLLSKEVQFAKDCVGPDVEHLVQACGPATCCSWRTSGSTPRREERRGIFQGPCRIHGHLCERRLRHGPPRPCVHLWHHQAREAVGRRLPDEEGDHLSPEDRGQPGAALRRHPGRRQGIGQDRRHREPQEQVR